MIGHSAECLSLSEYLIILLQPDHWNLVSESSMICLAMKLFTSDWPDERMMNMLYPESAGTQYCLRHIGQSMIFGDKVDLHAMVYQQK